MPDTLVDLLEISEPHLVERYGRALSAYGLRMPEVDRFRIDMIGFSPEIADALGDHDYLDPGRINRRFIILSPDQENLSLVQASFSNTRDLMTNFFRENRRVLYALTIKDVIFGEIEDNVYQVREIDDLLSIEQVEFRIGTHENLTEKTTELKLKIDRLLEEPDAWRDDDMLEDMVALAKQTGDIRQNALLPDVTVFRHDTFWSSHFGGTYVFHEDNGITVITDPSAKGFRRSRPWQVGYLDLNDQRRVFHFLKKSGRLQPPLGSWIERSKLLGLRKFMAAVFLADEKGDTLPSSIHDNSWFDQWTRGNAKLVDDDNVIPLINWAQGEVAEWDDIELDEVEEDLRFILCRADHADHALVNRLISQFIPFDFITMFEFDRPGFNREKLKWSAQYLEFVENTLRNSYLNDRAAMVEACFG